MTRPTITPHEDDLRTFAAGLRAASVSAEAAVHASAHDEDPGADLTAAVERAFDALRKLGRAPKCGTCGGAGRYGEDLVCGCSAGDSFRDMPTGKPMSEVAG